MNIQIFPRKLLFLLVVFPAFLACNLLSQATQPAQAPPAPALPTQNPPALPLQNLPTTAAGGANQPIRQWATDAQASSEYGSSDWAARQATGAPNTLECGDIETAWAAASRDTTDWINVFFTTPVYPTEIRILQSYNPDQVVQVELIDMQGQFITMYTSQPRQVDSPCPYELSIPVSRNDILVQGVHITINQSVLELGWNEIDAVEIAGIPGEGTPVRPVSPTP
jgi:hypothetical protein